MSLALCPGNCQVCVLKQRPDPAQGGALRWSLLYNERCFCQGVVAPRQSCAHSCPGGEMINGYGEYVKLWYVVDPTPLINRINWDKETLDMLLERAEYCGKQKCL